jgi:uncharacterized protein (TIGR02145 family)
MKTRSLFLIALLMLTSYMLFAQGKLIIHGGATVTVDGNLIITPPAFVCGNLLTDTRDGKTYTTVLIGTQCWMAQNLNFGARINVASEQTNNGVAEKYCYNDNAANCDIYGGLYQWNEMMNYSPSSNTNPSGRQGICPSGFHVPSNVELCQMETYLDATVNCTANDWTGVNNLGGVMKEAGTTHWTSPNGGATNSSGLTILPSGARDPNDGGIYGGLTRGGSLSTSTEFSSTNIWVHNLHYVYTTVYPHTTYTKSYGLSLRCLKD